MKSERYVWMIILVVVTLSLMTVTHKLGQVSNELHHAHTLNRTLSTDLEVARRDIDLITIAVDRLRSDTMDRLSDIVAWNVTLREKVMALGIQIETPPINITKPGG